MGRKSQYSAKSVSKGLASFTFVTLTFAIPIYAVYHLFKEKKEKDPKKPSPLLVTGGAIAVWYLLFRISGISED